ncbi:MAG: thiamine phosphate synthase, partial [Phycisphaerales bacterium]|nr:thiamine phosphate synthase [Phycisphaerales bacterium]
MNDLHRIIDANTNRASEGIRLLEDIARFSLNNQTLSQQLKKLRHQLRSGIKSLGLSQSALLNSRNTPADVGTQISTPNEHNRTQGLTDLATAAAKRAQEALRVLEESTKVLGLSQQSTAFESIRYALYDIERNLILALAKPDANWSVCVLLTTSLCLHHSPERVIEDAARAGARCIQIREKDMPADELLNHATKMVQITHDLGMRIIINDRTDIAHASDADGVHLGQSDLPIHAARAILGNTKIIGKTCSTTDQLHEAFAQGADYCGLGPVFTSSTKSKPNLAGIQTLQAAMNDPELQSKPILAISGITPANINQISGIG